MPIDSRLLIDQFPTATAVFEGPDHIVIAASDSYRQMIGGKDPIGKPLAEVVPELAEQGFLRMVDEVLATGRMISGTGVPARWDDNADGIAEEHYIDFYYQPLRNEQGLVRRVLL
jgi:PAS domain-containing protein